MKKRQSGSASGVPRPSASGYIPPKPCQRRKIRKIHPEKLAQDIRDPPDASQYERAAGSGLCQKSIWQALRKLGVIHNKASGHPQADAERRCAFRRKITAHEAAGRPIVYLDESGFATDMPRPHGSAPRGTRCLGGQNRNARGREMTPGALLAGASLCVVSVAALSSDPFPSGHICPPDHGGSHPGPAPGLPSRPPETPV